jgi:hypothetical protein
MGKIVKAVGGIFGGGGGAAPARVDKTPFKINEEADVLKGRIDPMLQQQIARQGTTSTAFDSANIAKNLALTASGQGPSLAQAQMKAAQDRNLSQLMAAQSAARTGSGAANSRNLATAMTMGNRNVAQDSASAKIMEQRQAQQDLMNLRGAEDTRASGLIQDKFNADIAAKRELQQAELAQAQATQQTNIANQGSKDSSSSAMMGALGTAAGVMLMSDKNNKKDIKSEGAKVDKFLEKLKSYSYEYKEPEAEGASPGKKVGVLAQDLEKSEMGKNMVKETEGGKMVSIPDSFSAILASQARLNERLSALEKKKKS